MHNSTTYTVVEVGTVAFMNCYITKSVFIPKKIIPAIKQGKSATTTSNIILFVVTLDDTCGEVLAM